MTIKALPPEIGAQFERIAKRNQLSVNILLQRNTELSQATWEVLKIFELNLRWHVNRALTVYLDNSDWSQDSKIFISKHLYRSGKITKKNYPIGLGFLSLLFSDRYHSKLWVPCLKANFPSWSRNRRELHSSLSQLVQVRNRIAHHEIIYNYPLIEIIDFAQEILVDINEFAAKEITRRNYAETINKIRLGSGGGI